MNAVPNVPPSTSIQLDDGSRVQLRPISPDDVFRERKFILSLSPEARRYRFLEQVNDPGDALIERLVNVDHDDQEAIVAIAEHGPRVGQMLGVVRYARPHGSDEAELALVVLDDLREGNLQRQLLQHLVGIARGHGIRRLVAVESADNRYMRGFAHGQGFRSQPDPDDHTLVQYLLDI